jgi:hypothetical protein
MATLFGKAYSRAELLRRVGSLEQIAGVRKVAFQDGKARGVEALEFTTGSGFAFTVLLGRGMDVSSAAFNGASLCWRSGVGEVAPEFFEPQGIGWLRSFGGGLLTTCGLTYLGAPCEDEGEQLGLHGRISNTPAESVCHDREWRGESLAMWARGKVREARVFGENVLLTRTISAWGGESRIRIEDEIRNEGFERAPLMVLYHFNFGFPLLDKGTKLYAPSRRAILREGKKTVARSRWQVFPAPQPRFREEVFYHDMQPDKGGWVTVVLANEHFLRRQGLGVYIRYRQRELPRFVQWKMAGEGTYVLGLEPANCWVEGRGEERRRGTLRFLRPGESRRFRLEFGVLASNAEIRAFRRQHRL